MPEDVTRDLKAFTPVGLDRDAVLYAAGKAAARRWAVWKWLALGLFVSNAVSLSVLFWPQSEPVTVPTADPEPSLAGPTTRPPGPSYSADDELGPLPAGPPDLVPDGPQLTVRSAPLTLRDSP